MRPITLPEGGSHSATNARREPRAAPLLSSRDFSNLFLLQPGPGIRNLGGIEILNLGHREWLADSRHPLFPRFFTDERDALDLCAMRRGKLDVVPQSVQVPAVEIVELRQHSDFALLGNSGVNYRHKRFVIGIVQLA